MLQDRELDNRQSSPFNEEIILPSDSNGLSRCIGGQLIGAAPVSILSTNSLPPKVTSITGVAAGLSMPGPGPAGVGVLGLQFFMPSSGNALDITQTFSPPKVSK
jgi:hypothetical protein